MTLVSVSDIELYMNIRFSTIQKRGVQMMLDNLHTEVESFIKRPLQPKQLIENHVVPQETWLLGDYTGGFTGKKKTGFTSPDYQVLFMRSTPIISVDSFKVVWYASQEYKDFDRLGESIFDDAYEARPQYDYLNLGFGLELYTIHPRDRVRVVYNAGLSDPEAHSLFRSVITRAAVREAQNMHDNAKGVKNLTQREVALYQTGISPEDKMLLQQYRKART